MNIKLEEMNKTFEDAEKDIMKSANTFRQNMNKLENSIHNSNQRMQTRKGKIEE
jgi:uncharacterized protein YoxC